MIQRELNLFYNINGYQGKIGFGVYTKYDDWTKYQNKGDGDGVSDRDRAKNEEQRIVSAAKKQLPSNADVIGYELKTIHDLEYCLSRGLLSKLVY